MFSKLIIINNQIPPPNLINLIYKKTIILRQKHGKPLTIFQPKSQRGGQHARTPPSEKGTYQT